MKLVFNPISGTLDYVNEGDISGTGIVGQVAEWVTDTKTLQAANLIAPDNLLTLVAGGAYSLTVPGTGTIPLGIGAANQVGYWSGTNTLTGAATLTYNPAASPNFFVQAANAAHVSASFRAAPGQTANLINFASSDGAKIYAYFNNVGRLVIDGGIGGNNIFVGGNSGLNAITGMENNIAIGAGALRDANNSAADDNFALGTFNLASLTSGYGNTTMGVNTAFNLTTGYNNVLLGNYLCTQANPNRSVMIGGGNVGENSGTVGGVLIGYEVAASASANTAVTPTIVGFNAGKSNRGNDQAFFGAYSGLRVTTGARGIFLGASAGYYQTTVSDLLIINSTRRANAAAEITDSIIYGVQAATPAAQTLRLNAVSSQIVTSALTNTVQNVAKIAHNTSGTPAASFGVSQLWTLQSSTTADQSAALIAASWVEATHATRKAKLTLSAYDTAVRLGLTIEADGSAAKIGLYDHAAVAQQVLATGAGATVDDVITALQAIGLVKQA